jgi:L-ascorbate metabolism protein UlaG (beta-lactamase superfamily)
VGSPIALRWRGHASAQIDIAGVRVLTDPALTRASPTSIATTASTWHRSSRPTSS